MKIGGALIKDTFAETFKMPYSRIIVTADDRELLGFALNSVTGCATSIIMCPCEAGVDTFIPPSETPDGRIGASVMFFAKDKESLRSELLKRLSQCILTSATASVFNGLKSEEYTSTGRSIAVFSDGWQRKELRYGRDIWVMPMMDGEFLIENSFGLSMGVAGGNFMILAKDVRSGLKAAKKAVEEIGKIPYTITPFPGGFCRSGSKVGSLKYKGLPASINHKFLPSLKGVVEDSELGETVQAVYELVINGSSLDAVKEAMRKGMIAAASIANIVEITAANYGGKLGSDKIYLKDILT